MTETRDSNSWPVAAIIWEADTFTAIQMHIKSRWLFAKTAAWHVTAEDSPCASQVLLQQMCCQLFFLSDNPLANDDLSNCHVLINWWNKAKNYRRSTKKDVFQNASSFAVNLKHLMKMAMSMIRQSLPSLRERLSWLISFEPASIRTSIPSLHQLCYNRHLNI